MPILAALALVGVALVVIVAMRPADFRVTRTATICAPTAVVYAQVNDLRKWEAWSPWAKLDPAAKKTYEGSPEGTGAIFSWAGNNKIGEGRMTITGNRLNELVQIKLEFMKPFKVTNNAEFTFKPEGNQTTVTWSMFGKNNFMAKAFHMIVNCDKMIGRDFENGLMQMKSVAEAVSGK